MIKIQIQISSANLPVTFFKKKILVRIGGLLEDLLLGQSFS
jgi:hypothetical protein